MAVEEPVPETARGPSRFFCCGIVFDPDQLFLLENDSRIPIFAACPVSVEGLAPGATWLVCVLAQGLKAEISGSVQFNLVWCVTSGF